MKLPGKASIGQSIVKKVNELIDYCRAITPTAGRGLRTAQMAGGTSISLDNHAADHAPGGKDEVKFKTLEIVWTDPADPGNQKKIIFNPNWEDFLAGRIFAVNDAGTLTGWRTLLDLLDGLNGFAAGKALIVNATADGLEFGEAGSELPANVAMESTATPFQAGKLVMASATAHELLGTLIGINLAGATYQGYEDNMVSTDARVAQIADARVGALKPFDAARAFGALGQLGVFIDDSYLEGRNLEQVMAAAFGTPETPKFVGYNLGEFEWHVYDLNEMISHLAGYAAGSALVVNATADGLEFSPVSGLPADPIVGDIIYFDGTNWTLLPKPAADKFLKNTAAGAVSWADALPASPDVGDLIYFNGAAWVKLAKPAADKFLKNTAAGALSWADATADGLPAGTVGNILYHNGTGWQLLAKPADRRMLINNAAGAVAWGYLQSSGAAGASLVTADGKIKTIYGD